MLFDEDIFLSLSLDEDEKEEERKCSQQLLIIALEVHTSL